MTKILWKPNSELLTHSHIAVFMKKIQQAHENIQNYSDLWNWSVKKPDEFWSAVWDFCGIQSSQKGTYIQRLGKNFRDTQWFPGAQLNFAENLLKRNDDHLALIFAGENGERRQMSYRELNQQVFLLSQHLKEIGIKAGDRIAGFLPNCIETVIAMLASAALGAVWSSCSPDFGLQGLLDRFGQIEPKVLFAVDGHHYNGKTFHHLELIAQLQKQLPSLIQTIIVPFVATQPNIENLQNTILLKLSPLPHASGGEGQGEGVFNKNSFRTPHPAPSPLSTGEREIRIQNPLMNSGERETSIQNSSLNKTKGIAGNFEYFPFNHPLYILYSSGTTGKPKCMVHGAGGTLIQHLKELMLHTNLKPNDRIFYYTTCGWMMWNWLISSLAVGATIILYDGAPLYPKPQNLFDLIDELKITIFGISAKFMEAVEKENVIPMKTHALNSLHTILSTGSPLLPESFDYVYQQIKKDVRVSSISGGSDIISCFALGNPILPVYRGELQCIGLGMDVKIFNEEGKSVINEKGELVCTSPFPSMPIYFWNDPHGEKYQHAYFDKYPHVWAHGDYALITERETVIIFGRSDATLNPGGVRVGTAEIYSQMNQFPQILESLAIAQQWDRSERIILFVRLAKNTLLTAELVDQIKKTIRHNVSPHHVPAKIIAVPDLPRTLNNKIAELAVKKIIHHETINNLEALANPESLNYFCDLEELKT